MKLVKTASGKSKIKLSKREWEDIGKKAGWIRVAEDELSSNLHYAWKSLNNILDAFEEVQQGKFAPQAIDGIVSRGLYSIKLLEGNDRTNISDNGVEFRISNLAYYGQTVSLLEQFLSLAKIGESISPELVQQCIDSSTNLMHGLVEIGNSNIVRGEFLNREENL